MCMGEVYGQQKLCLAIALDNSFFVLAMSFIGQQFQRISSNYNIRSF